EMITSHRTEWALRLPFALFGCAGIIALWYMLARLYSRRAAWLAAVVLATCPYYYMVTRQAITDMPSCALLIGSLAFFALAIFEEDDAPLKRYTRFKLTAHHLFLAAFAFTVLPQLVYFTDSLRSTWIFLGPQSRMAAWPWMIPFFVIFFG